MSKKMSDIEYIKRYFPKAKAKKILKYYDKDFAKFSDMIFPDHGTGRMANIVMRSFWWSGTNEGRQYWSKYHDKLLAEGK
jgi:hypothetical protein